MEQKVFGHLNPDTDSVCAAIVYAWYLTNHRSQPAVPYVLGSLAKEPSFVLNHFGVPTPALLGPLNAGDEVVIVDTNNPKELPEDLQVAELMEIVDHHILMGGLSSHVPIPVTIEPVACTTTVIWNLMQRAGVQPNAQMAGLMLAAILSDTLNFTSPTSTEKDKEVAKNLAQIAGINPDELAGEMFAAKSDISDLSASDLLVADSKVFELNGKKVRVSTLETTKPEFALAKLPELSGAITAMKSAESLDYVFFFIVNILTTGSQLYIASEHEKLVAEKAFAKSVEGELLDLPGVVSRKKQMIPQLESALR